VKRVAFATLGCKANWTDTEALLQSCREAGLEVVEFEEEADIYVVNTCTVTAVADQQSRQMLRRARRRNPDAAVFATGCSGEVGAESMRAISEIDAIFGTSDRKRLLEEIFRIAEINRPVLEISHSRMRQSRARAFMRIQDGCDRTCSYCIVPSARGKSRSLSLDEVVENARSLSRFHSEIVITGIDIGQYLCPRSGARLYDLVERLISSDIAARFRLSSLHPAMINDRLADAFSAGAKLCRHIHLSIQSFSDSLLKLMSRGYGRADIFKAVELLRSAVPGIAITGDLIVGFPGESEEDHLLAMESVEALPFAGLHVFPFSLRSGTKACDIDGHLSKDEVRGRAAALRKSAAEKRRDFLKGFLGAKLGLIVTSPPAGLPFVSAFSDNAISVTMPSAGASYGELATGEINRVDGMRIFGKWI